MSKKNNNNNAPETKESENKLSLDKEEEGAALTLEKAEADEPEKTEETPAEEAAEETPAEEAAEETSAEEAAEETSAEEPAEKTDAQKASEGEEENAGEKPLTEEKKDKDKKEKKEKKLTPEQEKKRAERKDRRSLKARAFKRGWFSIALVALFIAAVVVVNLIASTLVDKVPALVVDTTGSGSFELTDNTLDYIKTLDEDIRLIVLCDEKTYREGGDYYIQSDSLLHKYQENSDRITLEFMDLASNPTFTSLYPDEQLAQYSIIVQGEDDYRCLATTDYFDVQIDYTSYQYYIAGSKLEEAVTSAILNVTLDDKPKVSFISGISNEDYSAFLTFLGNSGFETQEISPAIDDIPEDTKVLVLFAPNVDLDAAYVDKISEFLNNGGSYGRQLLYLPSASLAKLPNIDSLLEEWGVEVDNGYAVENDMTKVSQITYGMYLFATEYTDSTYTANMKNSSLPFCVLYGSGAYTHSINILDESKAKTLLTLSDQSTVIYPAESGDEAEPVEEDKPSAAIGVIATKSAAKNDTDSDAEEGATVSDSSNIVVIGSNYAVTQSFLSSGMYGNASYMMSLLNTLVGRDNVGVTVEATSLDSENINITSAQLGVFTVLFVVLLPLAVLIAGIVIFVKRRNM